MTHTVKVLNVRKTADGIVDVLLRCCDDPSTDSWHSFHHLPSLSEQDILTKVDDYKSLVSTQHEASQSTISVLQALINGNE